MWLPPNGRWWITGRFFWGRSGWGHWQIMMSFFALMSLVYVQKKVHVVMLSKGCRSSFIFAFVFRMDFSSVAFRDAKGRRRRYRRHPCMAKGAGQMRKMWWVVVSDPLTRLRQVVCVLRVNLFRWVLLRQTHVSSRPCLELPSDPCAIQ